MSFKFHRLLLIFILCICGLGTVDCRLSSADDKQWSGKGDAVSWEDGSNWAPSITPTSSDDIIIDDEGANVAIFKTFNAQSVTVGGRKTSALTNEHFVYGTIKPGKNTDNALHIRKHGSVTMQGVGAITLKGAFKNSEESPPDEPAFMFGAE
jgi:hypothetical protein